jgi:DNA-binding NarL/FixJ family response regulator
MTALSLNHCSPARTSVSDDNHDAHDGHVLIADDRRPRSYHIWASLSSLRDVPAITTAESIEEVIRLADHHAPVLSLVSATFGTGEGFGLAHRLKHRIAPTSVVIYADAIDPVVAGAAMVAGADAVFAWEADADRLGELLGRVLSGEKVFPPLLPDPFEELASHVVERDRRIVAMLLEAAHHDAIARASGISARELSFRRQAIVGRLDAAYAGTPIAQARAQASLRSPDDRRSSVSRRVISG